MLNHDYIKLWFAKLAKKFFKGACWIFKNMIFKVTQRTVLTVVDKKWEKKCGNRIFFPKWSFYTYDPGYIFKKLCLPNYSLSDTAKLCHLIGFESAYFCSPVFVKIKKDILYTVLLQGMNPLPTCKLRSCYCTPILSTVAYYYYFFILLLFFL